MTFLAYFYDVQYFVLHTPAQNEMPHFLQNKPAAFTTLFVFRHVHKNNCK
jgi:hypothetical protein